MGHFDTFLNDWIKRWMISPDNVLSCFSASSRSLLMSRIGILMAVCSVGGMIFSWARFG